MIITRTPFRISFVGGGSDIRDFYEKSPGAVLSASINRFMYISSHHFFDENQVRVKYSRTETVHDIAEIEHPIVREVLKLFNITGAIEISSNADVPSGTGLGSSSAFTVGLLHNLHTVSGRYVTKERLADTACSIEIDLLREPIGKQDQYAAAYGGLNVITFHSSGAVSVEPIHLRKDVYLQLQSNLLMFYTGDQRRTASILSEQKKNMSDTLKFDTLKRMVELVYEMRDVLYSGDLAHFGMLLHKNWVLKKTLASKISTSAIDKIYDKALDSGAIGGKLLGAGGGGFLLFYCEKSNQDRLRKALAPLRELNFSFENEGTKVIYIGDEYNER